MARIRTLKPEFWQDEKLAPLSPLDRLVFLGLISMADDAGRLLDSVKFIDAFIFPSSDDSSRDSLDTLARMSRVLRYTSDSGQALLQIVNWQRHQKVDRPSKYVLPAPSRESVASVSRECGVTTYDLRPPTSTSTPVRGVEVQLGDKSGSPRLTAGKPFTPISDVLREKGLL